MNQTSSFLSTLYPRKPRKMTAPLINALSVPVEKSMPILIVVTVLLLIVAIVIVSDILHKYMRKKSVGDIPFVDDGSLLCKRLQWWHSDSDYDGRLARAYEKYSKNGKTFAIPSESDRDTIYIIPPESGREYYNLPKDHASWAVIVMDMFFLKPIVDLTWKVPVEAVHACSKKIPLDKIFDVFNSRVDHYLAQTFPRSKANDWHETKVVDAMIPLAHDLAVAVTIGPGFGKAEGISDNLVSYAIGVEAVAALRRESPQILGPLLWWFSSTGRGLRSDIAAIKKILLPEIGRRIEQKRENTKGVDYIHLDAMIELAFRNGPLSRDDKGLNEKHVNLLADEAMFMYLGGLFPIFIMTSVMLFHIIKNPETIIPLRGELTAALELSKGDWNMDVFNHAPKFESFSRETLRVTNPAILAGSRQALKPVTFKSLGMTFGPGSKFMVPSRYVQFDPDNYPNPMKFDPYRFYDPVSGTCDFRETITPSDKWLAFGIGTTTCPARILGLRTFQLIVAKILLSYDFAPMNSDQKDLPLMYFFGSNAGPNEEITMRIRSRQLS